jgi:sec-independent protein translocase protein TatA
MGRIGWMELLVILAIVVMLFGARKLPDIGKGIGEGIRNFKDALKEGQGDTKKDSESQSGKKN